MGDDFVPPVKAILKAIDNGIKLVRRVSDSASSASAAQALKISESSRALERSLDRCSQTISDAYKEHVKSCREQFGATLVADKIAQSKFKEIKNDIRDRLDEVEEAEEDPDSFNPATFLNAQTQVDKSCAECVSIFNGVREKIISLGQEEAAKDDRAQLSSFRQERSPSLRKPVPIHNAVSPQSPPSFGLPSPESPLEPMKPRTPWAIDKPSQYDLGGAINATLGPSPRRQPSRDISPSSVPGTEPPLIPKELVRIRISANDDFLERRRQSRVLFQNEIRKSVSSIEEDRVSQVFNSGPLVSPTLGSPTLATSPIDGRGSRASLNGYDNLMSRQRSLGQASQGTRSSRTSSLLHEQPQRHDSEGSIFGLRAEPLSPPISEHRSSGGTDNWGAPLATTLHVPGFGHGVEEGLELATGIDYDNEKIAVGSDEHNFHQPTPSSSVQSIDYPMRHDSSFYKYGGFCDGARAMIRGEPGFKVVKRPSGHYSATVSARCIKCAYEVGWNDVEKDRLLDRNGIYGNSGIRWRQKFISKCHVKTNSVEEALYACVFCIEEKRTIEEHDATVFFTVSQLFRHLAKHQRPLPKIAGIDVLYGIQPATVLDFDIHFTSNDPAPSPYGMVEIGQKIRTRPTAHAIASHHPKNTRPQSRDPDGQPVLHFAIGAKIVGITFPERFGGKWCVGYHDGERGAFPATEVQLEMPAKEDVLMDAQSTLITTAKWDFKPKDMKDGTWLRFNKGDKIVCIGYAFPDHWCWSGQTGKGKWGLFPRSFVEDCIDSGMVMSPPGHAISSSRFGLASRMSLSLGRNKTMKGQGAHERKSSIRSVSSSGSGGGSGPALVRGQPGLEVVMSAVHGPEKSTWRRGT